MGLGGSRRFRLGSLTSVSGGIFGTLLSSPHVAGPCCQHYRSTGDLCGQPSHCTLRVREHRSQASAYSCNIDGSWCSSAAASSPAGSSVRTGRNPTGSVPGFDSRTLYQARYLRLRWFKPFPGAGGHPLAGHYFRGLRFLQKLHASGLFCRSGPGIRHGAPEPHPAVSVAPAVLLAVCPDDGHTLWACRPEPFEPADAPILRAIEYGTAGGGEVLPGTAGVLFAGHCFCAYGPGFYSRRTVVRPVNGTAREPLRLWLQSAGQHCRRVAHVCGERILDSARNLVPDWLGCAAAVP